MGVCAQPSFCWRGTAGHESYKLILSHVTVLSKMYIRITRPSGSNFSVVVSSNLKVKPIYSYFIIASIILRYMKNTYVMQIGSG